MRGREVSTDDEAYFTTNLLDLCSLVGALQKIRRDSASLPVVSAAQGFDGAEARCPMDYATTTSIFDIRLATVTYPGPWHEGGCILLMASLKEDTAEGYHVRT